MPGTPHYPQGMGDVIGQMQRDQKATRTASQSRRGFDEASASDINVKDSNGTTIVKLGKLGQIAGEDVWGLQAFRADGTESMRLESTASGSQNFSMLFDKSSNVIFSDDSLSNQGIAVPHVPYFAPQVSGNANLVPVFWPRTTSGSFVTMLDCYNPALQPRLRCFAVGWTDASTTGEMQGLINGTQLTGSLTTLPAGAATAMANGDVYPLPGWGTSLHFQDDIHFELQIRRTGGTGNVYCQVFAFSGWQS